MGAEGFILANPCIPRFLKGLTHSAVIQSFRFGDIYGIFELCELVCSIYIFQDGTLKVVSVSV